MKKFISILIILMFTLLLFQTSGSANVDKADVGKDVDTEVSYAVKKGFYKDFGYNWDEASNEVQKTFLDKFNRAVKSEEKMEKKQLKNKKMKEKAAERKWEMRDKRIELIKKREEKKKEHEKKKEEMRQKQFKQQMDRQKKKIEMQRKKGR